MKLKKPVILLFISFLLFSTIVFSQIPEETIYKKVDSVNLKMYIFKPEKQDKSKAALILIHGGGWNGGKPEALFRHAEHFAKRGLTVFLPQYRLRRVNKTTIVEAVIDAKDAIAWVRKHAKDYNINPDKIIASGGSAGGHLAIMCAIDTIVKCNYEPKMYKPNCLVLLNPVLDVGKQGYGHHKIVTELKTYGYDWKVFSPIDNIKSGLPPTLVMVGDHDKVLPKPTALRFEKLMKKAGNECVVKIYPGGEHTFFNYGYANKKGYPKGTINKYYYEVLQDFDDFLVSHGYLSKKITIDIPESAIYPIKKD